MRKSLYKERLRIAEFPALITCRLVSRSILLVDLRQVCTKRTAGSAGGPRSYPNMGEEWDRIHTARYSLPFRLQFTGCNTAPYIRHSDRDATGATPRRCCGRICEFHDCPSGLTLTLYAVLSPHGCAACMEYHTTHGGMVTIWQPPSSPARLP